jgi:hypothetical protein
MGMLGQSNVALAKSLGPLTSKRRKAIFPRMSTKQITAAALALPVAKRVALAQALWQSVDSGLSDEGEPAAAREAEGRDQELSSGAIKPRAHPEVMRTARRAVRCT